MVGGQFSRSVVSYSLWTHGLQHARLPCPSPTPGAYSDSCHVGGHKDIKNILDANKACQWSDCDKLAKPKRKWGNRLCNTQRKSLSGHVSWKRAGRSWEWHRPAWHGTVWAEGTAGCSVATRRVTWAWRVWWGLHFPASENVLWTVRADWDRWEVCESSEKRRELIWLVLRASLWLPHHWRAARAKAEAGRPVRRQ